MTTEERIAKLTETCEELHQALALTMNLMQIMDTRIALLHDRISVLEKFPLMSNN